MSLHYNRDGSITMASDADAGVTQVLPPGTDAATVTAAYAAFAAANPPPRQALMAPLDFVDLFTTAEQAAIVAALPGSAPLFVWYTKMLAASQVDVTAADTIAGVEALATAGLITAPRAAAVLGQA